jgi:GNAT superfamily N-acetyltransferase
MATHPPPPGEGLPGGVVAAGPADIEVLSRVIAEAFFDLAPSRWLVPDPGQRWEIFPAYFRLHVQDALASGVVHTNTERTAVALWRHVGRHLGEPGAGYRERLAGVAGQRARRFLAFDDALDRHHPAEGSYHHLAILAVQPDQQRRGHGTALLRAYHEALDRAGSVAVYLEAASLRARDLYLHHGYTDHGRMIQLPGGPLMYPMARRAERPDAPDDRARPAPRA